MKAHVQRGGAFTHKRAQELVYKYNKFSNDLIEFDLTIWEKYCNLMGYAKCHSGEDFYA